MKTIYLGIGTNIGRREANLQRAVDLLAQEGVTPRRVSSTYETKPMYVTDQPVFLNIVVEAETNTFPRILLKRLQQIERAMGRKKIVDKGPRVIDIDILLFGKFVVVAPELAIPHPHMAERRFVMEPLAELAPELRHPLTKQRMKEMFGKVMDQASRKVEFRVTLPAPAETGIPQKESATD
ncbi:MAG: 2-amino-4-hydroxy-6-hydroxymethyldihydropteridine diphosphokinase [Bryobacterales bacterium]|nr:2-amino-4-hydroxy-6-hydroxymethyldihydropteridine diphosphokinase [Bryobacterales bacterium]